MAQILSTGVEPKTLSEYRDDLRDAFRAAFGEKIDLDAKSPQGQFIDNLALSLSQCDDAIVSAAGAIRIFSAFGAQLEGLASLLGIPKKSATSTLVTVTLAGVAATVVPSGSRAQSNSGDLYALASDTQLGVDGTASATMASVIPGAFSVLAGELTTIVDVVPGWETITNPADGTPGTDIESDVEYRQRYFKELFRNAVSVLDAIIAGVDTVTGVTEVIGAENDTNSGIVVDGVTIDPHSVAIVVEGGMDSDIKDVIRLKKTLGTGTTGTTVVSDPPHQDIRFFRPEYVNIEVTITTTAGPKFPADGVQLLKNRVLGYINGGYNWSAEYGYFELDGMQISEGLQKHRLYTPINSVIGHTVSALVLEIKTSPGDTDTVVTNLNQKIRFDSIDDINVVLL